MSDLRKYAADYAALLERIGRTAEAMPYRLLAEHGEDADWSPLPEGTAYGKAKRCYENSALHVLMDAPDLTYYEGLVATEVGTIEHAWAEDSDGRVYELTLRHDDPRCPFCDGNGTLHPTDHWDYDGADEWDDDEITCEQCRGSGECEPRDRSGLRYLGVPVPSDALRKALIANEVYGVLFNDPATVKEAIT